MRPVITAFAASPDRGNGMARDMRIRWALEEVGQPYNVRLVSFAQMKQPAHMALQPFGQIPTYEEDDLALFETGSILLHLAELHGILLPDDAKARARAISWMFAAVATVESPIVELEVARLLEGKEYWTEQRLPQVKDRIRTRLGQLSAYLGDSEWLDGPFSAADIMMVHVLRRAEAPGLVEDYPRLAAYIARATARPAYRRAFAAQLAVFTENARQP